MKKNVIGKCPICDNNLVVSKLSCNHCGTEISGNFYLTKFNYLSKEQLFFVEVFLKNKGNIKAIEKEMNMSYPTVKKLLDDVIRSLGYDVGEVEEKKNVVSHADVIAKIKSGELTVSEATKLMKK